MQIFADFYIAEQGIWPGISRVPMENTDQFAMPWPSELINELEGAEAIAGILKDLGVPGKGRGGAGNIENVAHIWLRQVLALLLGARARRVEDNGPIISQFAAGDGFLKQIAVKNLNFWVRFGGEFERIAHGLIKFIGIHRIFLHDHPGKGAAAGK